MTAAVVTLAFKKLKQPVVLGYLIAGFFLSPHFHFFPSVKDTTNIAVWAEIGVIFMLFGLGLEFSFKKLAKVGKSASITATFEIVAMLLAGYLAGQLLGWSKMDSLFLGGILSISSTTIIVRAFDELGMKGRNFVSLVFGVLIVEDLIAILLLVLLSSVAVSQSLAGGELFFSSLRLGFFLVLWFVLGIYLLPAFLHRFREYLSDETTLVVSIGLCLMMVVIASQVGFSPALGAFVMGSILAETRQGHRIEKLLLPVKDLFSAVFFVSVGMLIDPRVIQEYFGVILSLTFLTIVGKFLCSSFGALVSGRSLKTSVQAGMSLAQIGEFSFIIATLGMTLKVTSEFLYPVAVAVSALTTFSTPYLIKYAEPFHAWIESKLPVAAKGLLARYETAMGESSGRNVLTLVWDEYGMKMILNSVIVIAITLMISRLALPSLQEQLGPSLWIVLSACAIALLFALPFLWAIFLGGPSHTREYDRETVDRLKKLQLGISIIRFLLGGTLIAFVVSQFTSIVAVTGIALLLVATTGMFLFSRRSENIYRRIENRFLTNLNENERETLQAAKSTELAPWDASLAQLVVSPNSTLIAKTLQQSALKERFGITIAMIERGARRILAPTRDELLLPYDTLYLIGTEEQIEAARGTIEPPHSENLPSLSDSFGLASLSVRSTHPFVGKPIRECGIRELIQGLIVGIERNGTRILSPESSISLMAGDLLWVVGDLRKIRSLRDDGSLIS